MEDVVKRMRTDITVTLEGRTQESFRVSYVSNDPQTAQKVTERLASWYIEENLRDKERFSESTNQFLESELEDAKRRLMEHEKKLEEYRRRYSGQLPSQLDSNLQSIQNAQLQLQSVSDAINRASERRLLFERQLADVESTPAAALPEVASNSAPQDVSQLSPTQQLELARTALERAKVRYTPDHPDVRALERTIRELEPRAQEEARLAGQRPTKALSPAEAIRQKRIRDYRAELEVIDRQIANGRAEQARLQQLMAQYQAKVDALPSRESELVELTRDYTTLQASYSSLLEKRQESQLAANLERRNIGEQFKVLDPASLPERPVNQKVQLMVMAGGSMGGLMLGLLIVGFLEYRDSSFKTEEDIVRVLSLPVLALVPVMSTGHPEPRPRSRKILVALLAAAVTLGSAALAAAWRWQS
jgi:polysaccharide chain length determinant protein (PEP-CTERM system associated)